MLRSRKLRMPAQRDRVNHGILNSLMFLGNWEEVGDLVRCLMANDLAAKDTRLAYGRLLQVKLEEANRSQHPPTNPNSPKPIVDQTPIPYAHNTSDAEVIRRVVAIPGSGAFSIHMVSSCSRKCFSKKLCSIIVAQPKILVQNSGAA